MIYAYIGGALMAGLLVSLSVITIMWVSSNIGQSIRAKTVTLISSYDDLITEKSTELTQLNSEIEKQNSILAELKTDKVEKPPATVGTDNTALKSVERLSMSQYSDKDLSVKYQQIKDTFDIDPVVFIKSLSNRFTNTQNSSIDKFLEEISYDTILGLSTLEPTEQHRLLSESADVEVRKMMKTFCKHKDQFNVLNFYNYLKEIANTESRVPVLRISPGRRLENVPKGIKVEVDPDIIEGFQYIYNNKLYDYALKKKEIS